VCVRVCVCVCVCVCPPVRVRAQPAQLLEAAWTAHVVLECAGLCWTALDCAGLCWTVLEALNCAGLCWTALDCAGLRWTAHVVRGARFQCSVALASAEGAPALESTGACGCMRVLCTRTPGVYPGSYRPSDFPMRASRTRRLSRQGPPKSVKSTTIYTISTLFHRISRKNCLRPPTPPNPSDFRPSDALLIGIRSAGSPLAHTHTHARERSLRAHLDCVHDASGQLLDSF
jgi:hypothetical protein